MIHRLLGRQFRYRRQHAKSIAGQENDIGGMGSDARNLRVLDKVDGVCDTRVLGDRGIIVIDFMSRFVPAAAGLRCLPW